MKNHLLCILYDSIFNSVFESQVIAPIRKQLDEGVFEYATIISFERKKPDKIIIKTLIADARISLIVLKKIPFVGRISLRYTAWQLRKVLSHINYSQIIARGPLAGWVTYHATVQPFTLLARGLAAEEYRYIHGTSLFHTFRAWQYEQIEREVYAKPTLHIQAVSNALRTYLIEQFHTNPNCIVVSTHDVPPTMLTSQKNAWRTEIRNQLGIKKNANVYVYCGSAHAWQCPEASISYFAEQHKKNSASYLMILTTNQEPFKKLIHQYQLPSDSYYITTVPHPEIYHYLSAADKGLLFRTPHVVNWVSRPTKALEYTAVGLEIIHNNTIEMLCS